MSYTYCYEGTIKLGRLGLVEEWEELIGGGFVDLRYSDDYSGDLSYEPPIFPLIYREPDELVPEIDGGMPPEEIIYLVAIEVNSVGDHRRYSSSENTTRYGFVHLRRKRD